MTPLPAGVVRGPGGLTVPGNRWDLLDGLVPDPPPRVDVVVVHYRDPECLALVLSALARQTHPADRLRVIVADDGSPEPPEVPDGVTLVRQEDLGFRAAAARNLGAAQGDGDVLVFLDGDTVPEPGFVEALTRLPALAAEALVVGRRRHARLTGPDAAPDRPLPEPAWLAEGYRATRDLLDADTSSFRLVLSCALACSRTFFEELGGFDADLVGYGGEDWDLGWRAWRAGALLAHEPAAVAWHDGPDFAGRSAAEADAALDVKNAETLALASRITGPGTRPAGVVQSRPDLVVTVLAGSGRLSAAEVLLTVSAVLAGTDASVAVPGPVPEILSADPRVHPDVIPERLREGARAAVELRAGVLPAAGALASAATEADRVGPERVLLVVDGREAGSIRTHRGAARASRWEAPDPPPPTVRAVVRAGGRWVEEPGVESHVGGWGR